MDLKMSCLSKNMADGEDDYLIILHKDECNGDNELEEAIQLNLKGNYYMYQRNEFLDDPIKDGGRYSQLVFNKVDSIKAYIKLSYLETPAHITKLKHMISELFVAVDSVFQNKKSIVREIESLRAKVTSSIGDYVTMLGKEGKINYFLELVDHLLKKVTIIIRSESPSEAHYFKCNENTNHNESSGESDQMNSEINLEQTKQNLEVIDHSAIKTGISSELLVGGAFTNSDNVDSALNTSSIPISETDSGDVAIESETDNSNDSGMEEIDSDISQKSEPIINKNRMHKLYRRAGTVINDGDSLSTSDVKLNMDKYLKLIESYKNFTRTVEVKENISANNT
ncbi:hypothetical protein OIY81_103 [Cryptosporidium canis]|uniref:Uncharacterized protein n=1 Tax=Cryptosporidium canis TaxID=195482 RepID=A0ABQ8PD50_9CRYT|nr:hypothetical protein OJ252_384 [Cryptosporidium canis]KAJ1615180.1 hypothetical protein OIY81_103 [Cryptosporidium canis]